MNMPRVADSFHSLTRTTTTRQTQSVVETTSIGGGSLKKRLIALACSVASTAFAQVGGGYLGPGVLSSGATGIGNRSGQTMDLRFFAGVNGSYDSSVQPLAIDSKGNLVTVSGLYGVDATLGAYGTHSWRHVQLGLDYHGSFRHYSGESGYDGIDQTLSLGYTWQKSRRLTFNGQAIVGTFSNGNNALGISPAYSDTNLVAGPTTLLFDSRSTFLQGGMGMTIYQSPRTSYTFSGQGYEVWRQSSLLVGVEGYNARGTIEHRLSKYTSIGATYQRSHFDFPRAFGQADIDSAQGILGTRFGKNWTFTARAGIFRAEVSGLEEVQLNPVIAALLGQTTSIQVFHRINTFPSLDANLSRKFKTSSLSFYYGRTVSPGNGVYLTSRNESAGATYSYTGIRKASMSVSGGYSRLDSLGQGIQPYRTWNGGAGFSYSLPWALYFVSRYDYRYQQIESFSYKHTGYRALIGLSFSPGKVPLSLW
jgi:hypothetical protein